MKKGLVILALLACSSPVIAQGSLASTKLIAGITSVRYYNYPDHSRLLIRMDGIPHFTVFNANGRMTIHLGGTALKAEHDGARYHFSEGRIERLQIDRISQDSAHVQVEFRGKTRSECAMLQSITTLKLDAFDDTTSVAAADTSCADTSGTNRAAVIAPIQTITKNTAAPPPATTRVAAKSSVPVSQERDLQSTVQEWFADHQLDPRLAVIVIGSAIAGTIVILLLIKKKMTKTARSYVSVAARTAATVEPEEETENAEPEVERAPLSIPRRNAASPALSLARAYGRGQEEVNLSINLKGRHAERRWAMNMQKLAEEQENDQDSVTLARKLGVGRGEVDLALLLNHLKSPRTVKEGVA
jgi:hypothetical protein